MTAIALAIGVALVCPARDARADDMKEVVGTVVLLDSGDIVIDIGKKQGAADGDVLELFRPLKVKNPLNGKILTDRFRIGSVKITQARDVLSLTRPQGALTRAVEAGDMVILHQAAPPPPPPIYKPPTTVTPTATAAPTGTVGTKITPPPLVVESDPEAKELGKLFEGLHGTMPEVRANAYEEFVRKHPKSRFAGVLTEEAIALRMPKAAEGGAAPTSAMPPPPSDPYAPKVVSWKPPADLMGSVPVTVGVELAGLVSGAVLQLRRAEDSAYTPYPMKHVGLGYYTVVLPKERLAAPSIVYFIEAVGPTGSSVPVVGTAAEPVVSNVIDGPKALAPSRHEHTFALWSDYASYNLKARNDWALQTEGYFGMRFSDEGLRAVRSGFGVYQGKGGSINDLDVKGLDGRAVGLSYGYLEAEVGLTPFWALIGRAVVGLGDDGVTGGAQAFVRIGNDKQTKYMLLGRLAVNLMIGGEILGGVGLRGITQVELNAFPRFPMLIRSEVTNQPAGSVPAKDSTVAGSKEATELGFRALYQVGFRVVPGFVVFARASYQGRNINHAGPGGGLGVTASW